ncbi:hypothetical protein [Treponema pectinovorum]|uniref:hypothetical protein n=1 Tax=Treponema pectinovorum TaxID=164 RepID=UPI0011CC0D19|nr:hypothetical protein [Treponema pectinovorum]
MKKKKSIFNSAILILIVAIVFGLVSSCASFPKSSVNFILPQTKTEYRITLDEVEVNVEKVFEGDLSNQFWQICQSMLKNSKNAENALRLSIKINQRSFSKALNEKTSLFMFYTLQDESGNFVFQKGYYKNIANSVLSSSVQHSLCRVLCADVNDYLDCCKKVK